MVRLSLLVFAALSLARPAAAQSAAATPFDFVPAIFDVLRVETAGSAIIVGVAGPGVTVDLLDGVILVARAVANARGEWVVMPGQSLAVGRHVLAIRVTTADGRYQVVADRRIVLEVREVGGRLVASPIEPPPPVVPPRSVVVVRGDTLWDLALRFYGDGDRYGEIFEANRAQLRAPGLIFPGQALIIP